MKKALFISFFLLGSFSAFAQTTETTETTKPEVKKEEVVKPEAANEKKEVVKTVPASKGNKEMPKRVGKPVKRGARPSGIKPARSPRPVIRNGRPGRGR